ncbi:four helix bundle protein [Thalassotalea litorea]|uniref:four helix bundle protein n=1 Tax=Thalassotalea litorea TaxID=2020715 RepID=UPI0037360433
MYHEKLLVWKKSFELTVVIYQNTKSLSDFGFKNQITRSSLSVPSNIAEGLEKPTVKDKKKYLYIAKGSLAELKTQLLVGESIGYLESSLVNYLKQNIEDIDNMIFGLIRKIESR